KKREWAFDPSRDRDEGGLKQKVESQLQGGKGEKAFYFREKDDVEDRQKIGGTDQKVKGNDGPGIFKIIKLKQKGKAQKDGDQNHPQDNEPLDPSKKNFSFFIHYGILLSDLSSPLSLSADDRGHFKDRQIHRDHDGSN